MRSHGERARPAHREGDTAVLDGENTLRLAGVTEDSIVDGPGLRFTVFAQGCPHACPGCHNPQTHDPAGGYEENIDALLSRFKRNPLLAGVTLSGGEPFAQAAALAAFATAIQALGKTVWIYSGYTFEQILSKAPQQEGWRALLEAADVLVDGPFLLSEKTLGLRFRGSRNQRILDISASLQAGAAIAWEK